MLSNLSRKVENMEIKMKKLKIIKNFKFPFVFEKTQ